MTRAWVVSGRVQGVGFRNFTARHGERLGLRGVARNLPDGRVEVVADGEEAALDELARFLARGPSLARVTAVEPVPVPPAAGPFTRFTTA